jgi:SAM-dependent methyltransferase
VFELARPLIAAGTRVLDCGAGEGFFSRLLGLHIAEVAGVPPSRVLSACDAVPGQFRYDGIRCDPLAADGGLPYADASFGLVCSLEVIEHVEDQFRFLREAHRVLRPGGVLLLSTPNVLNMNSRWRYLHSGFAQLFDPLPLDRRDVVHSSGHIHPVSYYYLAYALHAAGFEAVDVEYDHFKRSALIGLALLGPAMMIGRIAFRLRMRRKRRLAVEQSRQILAAMNSLRMLTSRSVIVVARKAEQGAGS